MEQRRSRSGADLDLPRSRVLSASAMVGVTLLVSAAMVLLFPRQTLIEELRRESRYSPLAAAYVANMLRSEPQNIEFMLLLAQNKFSMGEIEQARAALAPVLASSDAPLRRRALLLEFDMLRIETYRYAEDNPAFAENQRRMHVSLRHLVNEQWGPPELLYFSRQARGLRDRELANEFSARLADVRGDVPANWLTDAGDLALGDGDYRAATHLYLAARQRASDSAERRRLFLRSIAILQSGGLLQEAIGTAESNIGDLADDEQTLEAIVRLCLAAGDVAKAQRYVRKLMKMAGQAPIARSQSLALLETILDYLVPKAHAQGMASVGLRPYEERLYTLAYEVFLANGNLADALRVAEAAVAQRPEDAIWRERLAQVAEWSGHPELALKQWMVLGSKGRNDKAWEGVLRLAPGLHEDEALLTAWQHIAERRRLDAKERRIISDLFERLARPQDGVVFFRKLYDRTKDALVLDEIAFLESRAGRSDAALLAFQQLIEQAGSTPERVIKLATLHVLKGDFRRALELLRPLRDVARPNDEDFWRLLGDVAWQTQDDDTASRAYEHLIDQGHGKPFDFERLAQLLRQRQPEEAARIAEGLWRNFRNIGGLMIALELYSERRDLTQVGRLFESIGPAEQAKLRDSAFFFQLRASYWLASGKPRQALADFRQALTLSPTNTDLKVSFLWTLIDAKLLPELRAQLKTWAPEAAKTATYWDAYAAGYVLLGEPRQALHYLSRQTGNRREDYLWLVNYADVLEETGDPAMAWRVRRHAWHTARASISNDQALPKQRDRLIGYARLVTQFGAGDPSLAVMRHLLRQDAAEDTSTNSNRELDATSTELILAWTISSDQDEAAKAWLWQRYARTLTKPLWGAVSVALAQNDQETLARLLDNHAEALPRYNRVDAARATQRLALAQQLGFDAQEKYPTDDEVHLRLATDLLASASSVTVRDIEFQRGAVMGSDRTARIQVWLTPRLRLAADLTAVRQHSTDSTQITGVPGLDRTLSLSALYRHNGGETEAQIGRRSALADFTTMKLSHTRRLHESVSATVSLSSHERALESTPLMIAGQKDEAAGSVQYALSMREFLGGRAWAARYATQGNSFLGTGHGISGEIGHRFRTEYPDPTLRLSRTISHFDASGMAGNETIGLSPTGTLPAASLFIPQSFRLWGMNLAFGTRYREDASRAIRPFMDIGRTANSVSGSGYNWLIGAGGSVAGADHLSAYWLGSRGGGGTNVTIREFGLRYQYFFSRY